MVSYWDGIPLNGNPLEWYPIGMVTHWNGIPLNGNPLEWYPIPLEN